MTLNVIFVCKTNDVLAVRKAAADKQALDELKALPAEDKPHGADRCVSPPTKKARLKTDFPLLAERQRFELWVGSLPRRFSRPLH